ncbi:ATP-binding protein [Streptomyces sp. NPDC056672]|uniref:ATP-binding protein n=1 Tax=Streptomyces sp. NPDC056672 TaxID=3345906 RepID=UPI0036B02275
MVEAFPEKVAAKWRRFGVSVPRVFGHRWSQGHPANAAGRLKCEETRVTPTTAQLIRGRSLGELVNHCDVNLAGFEAPQKVARDEVRAALAGRASGERVDEVILVADELVGNAVQHTDGPTRLTIDIFVNGAAVGVIDQGTDTGAVPADLSATVMDPVNLDELPEGGRGILLVALYANAWSVHPADGGKLVLAVFVLSGGDRR